MTSGDTLGMRPFWVRVTPIILPAVLKISNCLGSSSLNHLLTKTCSLRSSPYGTGALRLILCLETAVQHIFASSGKNFLQLPKYCPGEKEISQAELQFNFWKCFFFLHWVVSQNQYSNKVPVLGKKISAEKKVIAAKSFNHSPNMGFLVLLFKEVKGQSLVRTAG